MYSSKINSTQNKLTNKIFIIFFIEPECVFVLYSTNRGIFIGLVDDFQLSLEAVLEASDSGLQGLATLGVQVSQPPLLRLIPRKVLESTGARAPLGRMSTPEEVAANVRRALDHVPAERLVLASDCGMGREGMSRRHARYKMVALVQGTNIVRKELGLPEVECLAADPRYSLVVQE